MEAPFLPEAFSLKGEGIAESSALLLGSHSYEALAPVWRDSEEHARVLGAAGLIDRYSLLAFPVLLGEGKCFFTADTISTQGLQLRESDTYSNGAVKLVY